MAKGKEGPRIEEATQQQNGGQRNCILGICCPPGSEQSVKALAEEIEKVFGWPSHKDEKSEGNAHAVAAWVLENFDLAPKGSLQAFKDAVRDHAREGHVKT